MLAGEGLEDLAMTTNGQALRELAAELERAGLRRVNVSLNTLDPRTFREIAGGGELDRTLGGIDAALAAGLAPVKCNVTVLRGINDHEAVDLALWGIGRGVQVRFIELMPVGPAARRHRDWFVPAEEVLARLRARFDLQPRPRPKGGSCQGYRVADAAGDTGTVGIISSYTQPFCADCSRLRLTASGELVGCLARDSRVSVRPLLRAEGPFDEPAVLAKVKAVMKRKRAGHAFAGKRCMAKTGG
jgi:cyclic pyranopterin phosphate synthase